MNCIRCGHTPEQHNDHGCKVWILTGWKEKVQHFTGDRPCGCTAYTEHPTVTSEGCPHELTPNSGRCVHCGRPVKENAV